MMTVDGEELEVMSSWTIHTREAEGKEQVMRLRYRPWSKETELQIASSSLVLEDSRPDG